MRLFVVDEDVRMVWEGLGIERGGTIFSSKGEPVWTVKPSELVLTPSAKADKYDPSLWLLVRGRDGSAMFFSPTKKTERLVYLTRDELARREDESCGNCFFAHIEGNSRWFRQIALSAACSVDDDNESLMYDEDRERGPNDSLGPADTIVP